ncbi:MAG: hypothetical protein AAGD43_33935 [Pseudomonadota bacterium]
MRASLTSGQQQFRNRKRSRPEVTILKLYGQYIVVFILTVLAMVACGRATGTFSLVGYEWKYQSQLGLTGSRFEPLSLVSPVWLGTGDQLVANYDASIQAGQIRVSMKEGLVLAALTGRNRESEYISESGRGEVVLTAKKSGLYWPSSRLTSGRMSKECRKRFKSRSLLQNMVVPDMSCPTRSASYSITWSWRPAP